VSRTLRPVCQEKEILTFRDLSFQQIPGRQRSVQGPGLRPLHLPQQDRPPSRHPIKDVHGSAARRRRVGQACRCVLSSALCDVSHSELTLYKPPPARRSPQRPAHAFQYVLIPVFRCSRAKSDQSLPIFSVFSFANTDRRNKCFIKYGDSAWSKVSSGLLSLDFTSSEHWLTCAFAPAPLFRDHCRRHGGSGRLRQRSPKCPHRSVLRRRTRKGTSRFDAASVSAARSHALALCSHTVQAHKGHHALAEVHVQE
jgi:hypothetical protein